MSELILSSSAWHGVVGSRAVDTLAHGWDPAGDGDVAVPASLERDLQLEMMAEHARRATAADCGAVNIMVGDMQLTLASAPGGPPIATRRAMSICDRILCAMTGPGQVFVAPDTASDPDLHDNPWVTGELAAIRFYAGARLTGPGGRTLGTVCVFSWTPKTFEEADRVAAKLATARDCVQQMLNARTGSAAIAQSPGTWTSRHVFGPVSPARAGSGA